MGHPAQNGWNEETQELNEFYEHMWDDEKQETANTKDSLWEERAGDYR